MSLIGQEYQPPPQPSPNEPPIYITVSEPRIQIVEIGQTVKFDCNARPRFQTRVRISKMIITLDYYQNLLGST